MSGTKLKGILIVQTAIVLLGISIRIFSQSYTIYMPGEIMYEYEFSDGGEVAEHITIRQKPKGNMMIGD